MSPTARPKSPPVSALEQDSKWQLAKTLTLLYHRSVLRLVRTRNRVAPVDLLALASVQRQHVFGEYGSCSRVIQLETLLQSLRADAIAPMKRTSAQLTRKYT